MPIVDAKCTNCGATLQVDNSKEAMVCQYCGSAFVVEKAINNYNTTVVNNIANATINVAGANIENLITLAKNAEDVNNYEEARTYYTRVLEASPNNCEALLGKGVSALYCSDLNNINSEELIGYISKAIDFKTKDSFATDEEKNAFMLKSAEKLYNAAIVVMSAAQSHYNEYWKLQGSAVEYWGRLSKVIDIFQYVISISDGKSGEDFSFYYKESIKFIIVCCVEICEQRQFVSGIVNPGEILESEIKTDTKPVEALHRMYLALYDEMCHKIQEVEPDYTPKEINRNMEIKGGCYIATCVYGSYDCPEVWTLRRYRDFTLDRTWYGRAFIRAYYATSPTLVKWFGKHRWFKSIWKKRLDKMVKGLNDNGYDNTRYYDKY